MSGVSINSARTRDSNGVNDVSTTGARSYFGGSVDFTALVTVLREIPNRSAIRVCGTPSAANLLINAQSSKVITLQVSSAHFSPGRTAQFSTGIDSRFWPSTDTRGSTCTGASRPGLR
jgi:hypothetical protein